MDEVHIANNSMTFCNYISMIRVESIIAEPTSVAHPFEKVQQKLHLRVRQSAVGEPAYLP